MSEQKTPVAKDYFCAELPHCYWPKEKPKFIYLRNPPNSELYVRLLTSGYRIERAGDAWMYMTTDRRTK